MTWLIWNIRSWFCKHEWDYDENIYEKYETTFGRIWRNKVKVSATCKCCGYHRSYWKL